MTPYAESLLWLAATLGGGDVTLIDPRDASVHHVEIFNHRTAYSVNYGLKITDFDGQVSRRAVTYSANPFKAFDKPYRSEEAE